VQLARRVAHEVVATGLSNEVEYIHALGVERVSDSSDVVTGKANMELQMRTTYANAAKVLARFGAGLEHVVEEVLYVTDMDAAFAVAGAVRKSAYRSDTPQCASTIAQVTRLAFPQQLVEIRFTPVLPD
jgi:enamine deaminase RidA (YjgF/YER057c/UK114 family)